MASGCLGSVILVGESAICEDNDLLARSGTEKSGLFSEDIETSQSLTRRLLLMTLEQFDQQGWSADMKFIFKGQSYFIVGVDFEERVIGIVSIPTPDNRDDISWKRCENITLEPRA